MEKRYIAYNAGCGIWEVELFNADIDWHNNEYQGTKKECRTEAEYQMNKGEPHYTNAPYESIWDY